MRNRHLLWLALSAALSACSSIPKNAITIDRYMELDRSRELDARHFRISCKILDSKGTVTQLPVVTAEVGQEVTVRKTWRLFYPTKFDPPHYAAYPSFPVSPTTPAAFDWREVGDVLTVVARPRGPFVELSGSFVSTTSTLSSRGAGEALSPITDSHRRYLLTENKVVLPQIKRLENLIYMVGLPGSAATIHLDAQDSDLIITCEAIK